MTEVQNPAPQPDTRAAERAYAQYIGLHRLAAPLYSVENAASDAGLLAGLFIAVELNPDTATLLPACSISGAASLGLLPDAAAGRDLLRHGMCDFVVLSLDEALRILKNELRKRQPVSVCLTEDTAQVIAEMAERGVAPDVVIGDGAAQIPMRKDGVRGALDTALSDGEVMVSCHTLGVQAWRTLLLSILPPADRMRRRWVEASARFLPRQIGSAFVCGLRPQECDAVMETLASRIMVGEVKGAQEVRIAGETMRLGG